VAAVVAAGVGGWLTVLVCVDAWARWQWLAVPLYAYRCRGGARCPDGDPGDGHTHHLNAVGRCGWRLVVWLREAPWRS
jgi:hypothetical protein